MVHFSQAEHEMIGLYFVFSFVSSADRVNGCNTGVWSNVGQMYWCCVSNFES